MRKRFFLSLILLAIFGFSFLGITSSLAATSAPHNIPMDDGMYTVHVDDMLMYKEKSKFTIDDEVINDVVGYTIYEITKSVYSAAENEYYLNMTTYDNTTITVNEKTPDMTQFEEASSYAYTINENCTSFVGLEFLIYPKDTDFRTLFTMDTITNFSFSDYMAILFWVILMTVDYPDDCDLDPTTDEPIYTIAATRNKIDLQISMDFVDDDVINDIYTELNMSTHIVIEKRSNGIVSDVLIETGFETYQLNHNTEQEYDKEGKILGETMLLYPADLTWVWIVVGSVAVVGIVGFAIMKMRQPKLCPDGTPKIKGQPCK